MACEMSSVDSTKIQDEIFCTSIEESFEENRKCHNREWNAEFYVYKDSVGCHMRKHLEITVRVNVCISVRMSN